MRNSPEFISHVQDLLTPLGGITTSRMFSGHGFKRGGNQFAMVIGDTLYFRVNDETRPEHERHGMGPFSYTTRRGVVQVKSYAAVPVDWLEDREQFLAAASRALSVAG